MTSLRVTEIKVKVFSLRDFSQKEACFVTSGFVDACLSKEERYREFHEKNCFKGYSIDMPFPVEQDGVYKKEKIYTIRIRTMDRDLLNYLIAKLPETTSEYLKGLTVKAWVIPRKHISKLYSITPVIVKLESGGYWNSNISFEKYEELLKTNLIKKYNRIMDTKLDEDFQFYTRIQKINRMPIKVKYSSKNISLLGDKFDMEIADNETAQSIAYMALATGIGGNNSRACGFVNFKFL